MKTTDLVAEVIAEHGPIDVRGIAVRLPSVKYGSITTAVSNMYRNGQLNRVKAHSQHGRKMFQYTIPEPDKRIWTSTTRRCSVCKTHRTFDQFYKQGESLSSACKACVGTKYGEYNLSVGTLKAWWDSPSRAYVEKEGPLDTPCHIWQRSVVAKYPQATIHRVNTRVHRIALIMKLGRHIGPSLEASHLCHTQLCINPDHIAEETKWQNMQRNVQRRMAA